MRIRYGPSQLESLEVEGDRAWPLLIQVFGLYVQFGLEGADRMVVDRLFGRLKLQPWMPTRKVFPLRNTAEIKAFLAVLHDTGFFSKDSEEGVFANGLYPLLKSHMLMSQALLRAMEKDGQGREKRRS